MLEQEIKLKVLTETKLSLKQHPIIIKHGDGHCIIKKIVSTYYDTDDRLLLKNNVGLRIRHDGDQWYQTVKTAGSADKGLHQRDEWEYALDKPIWAVDQLRETPLLSILKDADQWGSLQPIFETKFQREVYLLSTNESNLIELAYDVGEVCCYELREPIHEIELELKKGSINVLIQLAEAMSESLPVVASNLNKSAMGYRLMAKN